VAARAGRPPARRDRVSLRNRRPRALHDPAHRRPRRHRAVPPSHPQGRRCLAHPHHGHRQGQHGDPARPGERHQRHSRPSHRQQHRHRHHENHHEDHQVDPPPASGPGPGRIPGLRITWRRGPEQTPVRPEPEGPAQISQPRVPPEATASSLPNAQSGGSRWQAPRSPWRSCSSARTREFAEAARSSSTGPSSPAAWSATTVPCPGASSERCARASDLDGTCLDRLRVGVRADRRDRAPGPSPASITDREREQLEMRCRALNTRVILAAYRRGPWGEVVHLHTASTRCPARCHATGLC
jgi:hypothetical protein